MTAQIVPLTNEDRRLSDLVNRANESMERFVLTREGEAKAVLLSADDFEGLLETLEILSDTDLVKRLIEADKDLAVGGGHSLEEVREGIRNGRGPTVESG